MDRKKYQFKPCRVVCLFGLIFISSFLIPLYIAACVDPKMFLLPTVIIVSPIFASYFVIRISYKTKYIIDDEYLTAYQGKKIFLKIKKSDIEYVFIKKGHWYDYFGFCILTLLAKPIDALEGRKVYSSREFSSISFVYKKFEIKEKRKVRNIARRSIRPEELENWNETVDVFSYRQSKRICKLLGKEPIMVKKEPFNVEAD